MARERLYELDRAKAIAITLVVIGHIVAKAPPLGNEWYIELKTLIYNFHMPFFMFLSGAVFYYTSKPVTSVKEYIDWVTKKAFRLVPGFLIIGVIIIFGKIIAGQFMHVDNLQTDVGESLYALFIEPASSPAGSLWYIYVLFEFYLMFPLALALLKGRLGLLVAITLVLHILHVVLDVSGVILLNNFFEFSLFFALGVYAIPVYDKFKNVIQQHQYLFFAIFIISFFSIPYITADLSKLLIGLCSIPAILGVISLRKYSFDNILLLLSEYTFTIYLLNTLAIGFTKGMMLKFMSWDGSNFILFFFVLGIVGVVAPIIAHKLVFSRVDFLYRAFK